MRIARLFLTFLLVGLGLVWLRVKGEPAEGTALQTAFTRLPACGALGALAGADPELTSLAVDGGFGERTLEAVMLLQREFFPPVTGRVDQGTWDAITALYRQAERRLSAPLPVTTGPGDESVHLNSAQSMFRGLSEVLDGVEPGAVNGRHDGPTTRNLQWLQRAGGRPETGRLDPESQHTLEQLYRIFVTHAQSPWLTRPELLGGQ